MEKIAIIVLHYKEKKLTLKCLESLRPLLNQNVRLIVVDNHSPEPIADLTDKFPEALLINNQRNLGYAEGNNVGIREAMKDADYILLLNNDVLIHRELLSELMQAAKKDKKIGIIGPKIYFAPGAEFHQSRYKPSARGKVIWYAGGLVDWNNLYASHRGVDEVDKGQYDRIIETDFVSGCAMLVRREVFEKAGLLDYRYFLYLEDLEFCTRVKLAGFKVTYAPKARLWHLNAGSSAVGGPLHDYFFTRNRLLFGLKYASSRTKLALLRESIKLLVAGRPWQKIGVKDFYLRKFGKGSWLG